jgi:hypothetical protein
MTQLPTSVRSSLGWYARLIDARLSQEETERWQRLVHEGMRYDAATAVVVSSRSECPVEGNQA